MQIILLLLSQSHQRAENKQNKTYYGKLHYKKNLCRPSWLCVRSLLLKYQII